MADFTPINSQEELNNVIGERLRRERETVSKEFEEKIAAKDAEIGTLRTDTETVKQQLAEANEKISGIPGLEEKLRAYERASVKNRVAREVGIPYELAERLAGETEEDMRKDAESLKKLIGSQQTAPLAGGERSGAKASSEDMAWLKFSQDLKGD